MVAGDREFELRVEELSPHSSDYPKVAQLATERRRAARDLSGSDVPLITWRTLRRAIETLGSYRGVLRGPDGLEYEASLEPWRDCDLDKTFIRFAFRRLAGKSK